MPARICAAHVQRQDTDCAGAAAGGRGVCAQVACCHLLAWHARQSVLRLHTLHPLFLLTLSLLFFYSTPCTQFFVVRASLCAVQACMLSCICAYTYIFLKYIHIRIHSYIGPATRHRASTWHHTGSLSLRFSLSLSHTHTNTHMRTRHRNLASLHRLCVRCVCVCVRTCTYVCVRVRT